jgi:hypothetical protein
MINENIAKWNMRNLETLSLHYTTKDCTAVSKMLDLFRPTMSTMLVGAHVIESHFVLLSKWMNFIKCTLSCIDRDRCNYLSTTSLCLEKYSLLVSTFWAWMVFCPGQSWVGCDITYNVCQFTGKINYYYIQIVRRNEVDHIANLLNFMCDFVDINAIIISQLLVVTISALK